MPRAADKNPESVDIAAVAQARDQGQGSGGFPHEHRDAL